MNPRIYKVRPISQIIEVNKNQSEPPVETLCENINNHLNPNAINYLKTVLKEPIYNENGTLRSFKDAIKDQKITDINNPCEECDQFLLAKGGTAESGCDSDKKSNCNQISNRFMLATVQINGKRYTISVMIGSPIGSKDNNVYNSIGTKLSYRHFFLPIVDSVIQSLKDIS